MLALLWLALQLALKHEYRGESSGKLWYAWTVSSL